MINDQVSNSQLSKHSPNNSEPNECFIPNIELELSTQLNVKYIPFQNNRCELMYCKYGNLTGPLLVTVHDIGQNSEMAFHNFFACNAFNAVLNEFCICHVDLPGHHSFDNHTDQFPDFDEISAVIVDLIDSFKAFVVIGLGIGAGGNIIIRSHLLKPHIFRRLILINTYVSAMGWNSWLYQKFTSFLNEEGSMSNSISNLLIDHFFHEIDTNDASFYRYIEFLKKIKNPSDLLHMLEANTNRTSINLIKPDSLVLKDKTDSNKRNILMCETLVIVSRHISNYEECEAIKEYINPALIEYIEFNEGHGMILDQFPEKLAQAIIFFLQGLGYLRGIEVNNSYKPQKEYQEFI